MKIREINVDNIVEFLNSKDYTIDYLTNRLSTFGAYRFNLKDYRLLVNDLVRYFFSDVTYTSHERTIDYVGAPICENKDNLDKVVRNANELTFLSMYPNIILNLYDRGEVEFNIVEFPELYRFFVNNQNEIERHPESKKENKWLVRLMKNYLYGSSANKLTKVYVTNIDKVVEYYKETYGQLTDIEGFLYADVDILYFENSAKDKILEIANSLDIPYEVKEDISFCYFNTRRYVSVVDGKIKVRGYDYPGKPNFRNRKSSPQYEKVKEIVNKFEIEVRQHKLDKLICLSQIK